MILNLYLISQDEEKGYNTYDSAVVAATTAKKAQETYPINNRTFADTADILGYGRWAHSPDKVTALFIGKAKSGTKPGVICASFNAG